MRRPGGSKPDYSERIGQIRNRNAVLYISEYLKKYIKFI